VAKKNSDKLTETAREIGGKLGEAKVKATRLVEGVKAAVRASRDAYSGKPKSKAAKKKSGSARPRAAK
jgi:hypothetical protein